MFNAFPHFCIYLQKHRGKEESTKNLMGGKTWLLSNFAEIFRASCLVQISQAPKAFRGIESVYSPENKTWFT